MDNEQVLAVNDERAADEASAPPKRAVRTRRKVAPKAEALEPAVDAAAAPEAPASESAPEAKTPDAKTKAPARRTRSRKQAEPAEAAPAAAEETAAPGAGVPDADAGTPAAEQAAAEKAPAEKPVRRRASRAKAAAPVVEAAPASEATAVVDSAPEPVQDIAPATVTTAAEHTPEPTVAAAAPAEEEKQAEAPSAAASLFLEPGVVTSMIFQAPDLTAAVRPVPAAAAVPAAVEAEDEEDEDEDASGRRRRRSRGRRTRTRVAGESDTEAEGSADEAEDGTEGTLEEGVTSRRRRRRRRGEQDLELTGGGDDDPPNTVIRVRAPRALAEAPVNNRVTSVKGSTRLEAKKQRRRESRDTGRRRTVITEAEFLARRESVDRQMIVRQRDDRIQIGVLEDGVLAEHFVSKTQQDSLIGNVYLGKVQNVLPSMEAAFVDIGRGRNAVLYAGEVNWEAVNVEGKQRRIENALKSGDSVLVQVTKDPVGHKGARLTSQISLPGRYLVYVPGGSMTGISRKLPDVERNRLKRILKDRLPEDAGVIVRTAAEGASEEELTHDINRLRAQWEGIESQSKSTKVLAPELLYGEPDLTIKVVRDVFNEDFSKLIVSGEEAWDTIEAYVTYVAPDLVGRLEKWTKDEDIFSAWRIDEQIHKALDRKVFLPSGGSLVIDRTEAMTVVDVNTGKFTGSGGNLEETVTKNNLEAAEEVVRQLRLRDIGGMIVIDFIDMVLESNRDLVLRRLTECLGRDRTKHQVAEVTSLGLVQMTRKRVGQGLLEVFSEPCEHCRGRGVMVQLDVVDEKRRSGGNGSAGAGPGSGGGGNGRNRDRERAGRDAGDQPRPDTTEQPDAVIAAAEDAGEVSGQSVGETPTEGRSGRRGRGRRGRGQAGEARAAEDAAVLAGTRDDEAADEAVGEPVSPPDGEALAEVLHESVGEELAAAAVGAPEEAALSGPADEAVDEAVDEAAGGAHPVAAPAPEAAGTGDVASPAAEPPEVELVTTADEDAAAPSTVDVAVETEPSPAPPVDAGPQPEPAVAPVASTDPVVPVVRPRRRRAASRPAGPPA
ncbi:MAG: Rne/Rng family ribonuclease [Arthrobacter sp.]|nr:Rne/Rng family ribonuclease [Arthrobacter sp.]